MPEIQVDFRGAPPATRGGSTDIIPQGYYLLRVDKIEANKNEKGLMVIANLSVARGEQEGARLRDSFFPSENEKGSKFGIQVFHMFLLACGVQVKEAVLKFNTDALQGKMVVAEVRDGLIKGNARYPDDRKISQPVEYWNPKALPAEVAAAMGVKAAPAPAPAPAQRAAKPQEAAPAPVQVAEVASADPLEDLVPASANGTGPVQDDLAEVAEGVDDLFR